MRSPAAKKIFWNSTTGSVYSVLRSIDLVTGTFVVISNGIAATPPTNTIVDCVDGLSNAFYVIRRD